MKRRLSASIDEQVYAAVEAAVRDGRAPSVSALVEEALRRHDERLRKLAAMDDFFRMIDEERGGPPSDEELERLASEFERTHRWRGKPSSNHERDAA